MQIYIDAPSVAFDKQPFTLPNIRWAERPRDPDRQPALIDRLVAHNAQALVCEQAPSLKLVRDWQSNTDGPLFIIHAEPSKYTYPEGVHLIHSPLDEQGLAQALTLLERRATMDALHPGYPASFDGTSVILVGAGITNLVLAVDLVDHGYALEVFDTKPRPGGQNWREYGCSHGGGDARMFTLTEMDSYNSRTNFTPSNPVFEKKISEGGWLIQSSGQHSGEERDWLETHNMIPPWLASIYSEDIYDLNAEAMQLWEGFRKGHPDLFDTVVHRDGILRLYSDKAQFEWDIDRQTKLDALLEIYQTDDIVSTFPALADACQRGQVAGAIMVKGFTVNIHKFTQKLIAYLEAAGVTFRWNSSVSKVLRNKDSKVVGLLAKDAVHRADHYVISPGIYGEHLMQGTDCAGQVHGVLGAWLEIPNAETPINHSMKLARKGHLAEDSNITVARDQNGSDTLIIGSGYGYIGNLKGQWSQRLDIDQDQLMTLYAALDDTAETYFADCVGENADRTHPVKADYKYCVRPWTATSLGLYHCEETEDSGSLIITGGHNTGGFAQSPVISRAVLSSLRGQEHRLHYVYHPRRHGNFVTDRSSNLVRSMVPDVTFQIRVRDDSLEGENPYRWMQTTSHEIFGGKRALLFALPGAFTPTCSTFQLPGFEENYKDFQNLGIDEIFCLSVNDSFVMNKWAKDQGIKQVKVIPDGAGLFTKQMGMLVDKSNLGFGLRSWRYAAIVNNGDIEAWFEEPGRADNLSDDPYGVSSPENLLAYLRANQTIAAQ